MPSLIVHSPTNHSQTSSNNNRRSLRRGGLANPDTTSSNMSDSSNNFFSSIKGSIRGRLSRSSSNASNKSAHHGQSSQSQSRGVNPFASAASSRPTTCEFFFFLVFFPLKSKNQSREEKYKVTDLKKQQMRHLQHTKPLRPSTSLGLPALLPHASPPSPPPRPRTNTPSSRPLTPSSSSTTQAPW